MCVVPIFSCNYCATAVLGGRDEYRIVARDLASYHVNGESLVVEGGMVNTV